MKRFGRIVISGLAGLGLAVALVAGALRLSGTVLSEPARPIRVSVPPLISLSQARETVGQPAPTAEPERSSSTPAPRTGTPPTGTATVESSPEPGQEPPDRGDD